MTAAYLQRRPGRGHLRKPCGGLALPLAAMIVLATAAVGYVGYVLWPRWPAPPVAPNAPALPITVASLTFNVPPGAIRIPMQRQAGTQVRLDLAFSWPALEPPDPSIIPAVPTKGMPRPKPLERIFVTITAARDGLSPDERVRTIYPRYLAVEPVPGPDGLAVLAFRAGTPYQGEDLIYDPSAPENFLLRCSRAGTGATPGICLHFSRIDDVDITLRFPRGWLEDWRSVADGIGRLMRKLHPPGG